MQLALSELNCQSDKVFLHVKTLSTRVKHIGHSTLAVHRCVEINAESEQERIWYIFRINKKSYLNTFEASYDLLAHHQLCLYCMRLSVTIYLHNIGGLCPSHNALPNTGAPSVSRCITSYYFFFNLILVSPHLRWRSSTVCMEYF